MPKPNTGRTLKLQERRIFGNFQNKNENKQRKTRTKNNNNNSTNFFILFLSQKKSRIFFFTLNVQNFKKTQKKIGIGKIFSISNFASGAHGDSELKSSHNKVQNNNTLLHLFQLERFTFASPLFCLFFTNKKYGKFVLKILKICFVSFLHFFFFSFFLSLYDTLFSALCCVFYFFLTVADFFSHKFVYQNFNPDKHKTHKSLLNFTSSNSSLCSP